MANVIIFTDRPPGTWNFDKVDWNRKFLIRPAGAYAIASRARINGFSAVVVPNAMSFSFAGIKHIIQKNSKDLLWVGVSTTFFNTRSTRIQEYRRLWVEEENLVIKENPLYQHKQEYYGVTEIPWGCDEINLLSQWVKENYDAQILIGGTWVTYIKNGNLNNLDENVSIVTGYAEDYVEKFTFDKFENKLAMPSFINDNRQFDENTFKNSFIKWDSNDAIESDEWLPIEIARGCAFRCAYCDHPKKGSTDNYKDPETLHQEIIRNYEEYGVTRYILMDDLYNDDKEKVRILYDKVWSRLPFNPEWTSYMRLDMFWADPESIQIVKASGARMGSFGIETLHDGAGKKVGKGLGKSRIIDTLQMIKQEWKDDVLVNGLFIAGLPFEPLKSIEETMEWTKQTDLLYSFNWNLMWISPPTHKSFVLKHNTISEDYDKFGVKWIADDDWINTEGITFKQISQIYAEFHRTLKMPFKIGFSGYPDFRLAGLTHEEIVALKENSLEMIDRLKEANQLLSSKIDRRIKHVLSLEDH